MVTGERQASRLGTGATRALMLAIAVVDLVVAAMAWRALRTERAAAYEKAGQSVSDLARVLGENLEGTITRIDLALLASAHVLEEPGAMSGAARWRTEVAISRIAARLPIIDAIRATDADGTLVLGKDLKRDERVSVVDRDYFLAAKADPNARLSTSSPMIDRVSRRWSIAFARPYYRADGSFAGIVHAVVRTDTFTLTLGRVKAPYEGAVVLRGADNAAIARYPDLAHGESLIGQRKISPKLEEVVASRIAEATFPVQSPVEHQETLAAFRRIAGSPFYLLVTALSQSFLASWRMEAERTAIAVAVFVLLTFLAARAGSGS
ncbi:MAG TPA: hypothetical protein VLT61_14330, partial [Anaeromyxobacteraceae bacterium]|nr:hypothetical protein [Anaeromyxobacteraceae bacterium]